MRILQSIHVKATNSLHLATRRLRRLGQDEGGASVIEYAILLGVIVGAVTLAVTQFGNTITTAINDIAGRVTTTVSTVGST